MSWAECIVCGHMECRCSGRATEAQPELLPCPFCGGVAEYEEDYDANYSNRVACQACPAAVEVRKDDFSRWNRRAQPAPATGGEPVPASTGREPCPVCAEGKLIEERICYCSACGTAVASPEQIKANVASLRAARELDVEAERRDFAATFDADDFNYDIRKHGPEAAAFGIWLAARVGSFLRSGSAAQGSAPAPAKKCEHENTAPAWRHVDCLDCGAIFTGSDWGIAARMWFKSTAEAEFYKKNGRYPDNSPVGADKEST